MAEESQAGEEQGCESLLAARADPSLLGSLPAGSWFTARWRARALRRAVLGLPQPLARMTARMLRPWAADLEFWIGVRREATPNEWELLTGSYVALCYHRIAPTPGPGQERMVVPPKVFRRQLTLLRAFGFRALDPDEILAFHTHQAPIGRRRFALTADDGFRDCVEVATRARLPMQLFVPTTAPGRQPSWMSDGTAADWDALRASIASGATVGSHGRRHIPLTELDDAALELELTQSRADLRKEIAQPIDVVAYPNGRYDERVRQAAIDAGYRAAYTTDLGRNGVGTDPWSLRRVTPKAWDSSASFLFRVLTGEPPPYRWEQARQRVSARPTVRERAADQLATIVARVSPGREYRSSVVLRELERQRSAGALTLLDAGSEDGRLATTIARRHPLWHVIAADMNPDALAAGLRRARSQEISNVSFLRADLTTPIRNAAFDVAIAVDSLTEVPNDRAAIMAIGSALRPGGLLVVHTPEADWRPVLQSSLRSWPRAVRRGYRADELTKLLEDAGLRVASIRPTYRAVGHLGQEVRDRWVKGHRPLVQAALLPLVYAATVLEQRGLTFGQPRAMLVVARRL